MAKKGSEEWKTNISNSLKGRKRSQESINKQSASLQKYWSNPEKRIECSIKRKQQWDERHEIKKRFSREMKENNPMHNKIIRKKHLRAVNDKKHRQKHSECMIGDNNPNWKGGISFEPYDSKFNRKLKRQIKIRDNFTCQLCFTKKMEKLCIHHIDYNKQNSAHQNLITLCYMCNSNVNYNRDFWHDYFNGLSKSCNDSLMRLQQILQTLQRFTTLETKRVVPSTEGIKGVEGLI